MGIGDWGLGIGPNPQFPIPHLKYSIPQINEFFPKFKGRNIIFSIDRKQIKANEPIKNYDFDATKIFIEYLE